MAKILVTGGAGFIGSHVVDHYLAAGHAVAVVDDLSSGSRDNLNPKAALYELDIRDDALGGVFEKERPDFVNHLAAQMDVRRSVEDPAFDADVNVRGSIRVLEQCVRHGVKKLFFASTGGAIYGEPAVLPASESTPAEPLAPYGLSKFCVEQYILLYQRIHGLPYTILRFPNVYGPRQSPHGEAGVCAILIGLMLAGKRPVLYGHGEPTRDYVYVGDIARACVLALDKAAGATLNLGSGVGTSVRELFDITARLTDFAGAPELAPLRKGEIAHICITGDKAAEQLGWTPEVGIEEGLRRTVAHIREAGA
ncbi:MAG: NAD-dependent epimerase/dehydratase family protein [Candidatus Hydrogenedentota bacterium]